MSEYKSERKALTQAFEALIKEIETLDSSPFGERVKVAIELIEARVMLLEMKAIDAEIAIAELRKL
jgi:hypothetical protein